MLWKTEYTNADENVSIAGYSTNEADCRTYFRNRVSSKVSESNGAEQLRIHLTEMAGTGFDTSSLLSQISSSPPVKDWEVGEAFAEAVLEDEYEVMFPWETGWDKRARKASLPGPDIVGLKSKKTPGFIFGEVKSSSEQKSPPQVVSSGDDCLKNQIQKLCHSRADRQQLVEWLLMRTKDTPWQAVFNEALQRYSDKKYWVVGVLASGGRSVDEKDLSSISSKIEHETGEGELSLLAYYLPFEKNKWPELLVAEGAAV